MVPEWVNSKNAPGSTNGIHTNGHSFPDDVPTAPLLTLSFDKLAARDPEETPRLLAASLDTGFFYLDLRNSEDGESILEIADKLFNLAKEIFNIPAQEKEQAETGRGFVATRFMIRGLTEVLNIQKEDILSDDKRMPTPDIVNENRDLLRQYVRSAHAILSILLNNIGDCLRLPHGTLANMHRMSAVGTDQIRLTRTNPPHMEHGGIPEHRDASSMTLLFNKQSGLQILPPGGSQWCYVRPLPGHAIVNLGDAMVTFTNGLLRSNPHRVVAPCGSEVGQARYSLVYFMRPENAAMIKRLEGSDVIPKLDVDEVERDLTGEEWVTERFKAILAGKGLVKDRKHR